MCVFVCNRSQQPSVDKPLCVAKERYLVCSQVMCFHAKGENVCLPAFMFHFLTFFSQTHTAFPHHSQCFTSLPRPQICDTSVSATGDRNGYTDQTWITSGTFSVQFNTRTNSHRVKCLIQSSPSDPVFSLHLSQRERHKLLVFKLQAERLISYAE